MNRFFVWNLKLAAAFRALFVGLCVLSLFVAVSFAHADTPEVGEGEDAQTEVTQAPVKAGWNQAADGIWRYFDFAGNPQTGWLKSGGKWYWLDPSEGGAMSTKRFIDDEGARYYVDGEGVMQTGWFQVDGKWYHANTAGSIQIGWLKSGNKWYWLIPDEGGKMAQDQWIDDNGQRYYLTDKGPGQMATGWFKVGDDWYYANNSGAQQKSGWVKSGSKWYWLQADQNGRMAQDQWIDDNGQSYYLTNEGPGQMATGWFKVGNDWYYANNSGAQQKSGWVKSGSKWYWLEADQGGKMATDSLITDKGSLYSLDADGVMRVNCGIDLDNNGYGYAASSGAISRIGEYVDGKVVLKSADGSVITGWKLLADKWFYGDPGTGIMHTGWLDLNGTWYYLDGSGAMVTGTRTIDGKTYSFGSSGAWINITGDAAFDSRIIDMARSQGSLRNCFNWVKGHAHTSWATSSSATMRFPNGVFEVSTPWVVSEAKRMFDGQPTDCYSFACAFAVLAKALGYDAKVVTGHVPSRSAGWASHAWVEINQGGTTYVYDTDLARSYPNVNFYGFTYASAPTNYHRAY